MENSNVFMYVSVVEGCLIVCMLGWEVFWLRKMYQVLQCMPTSKQINEMVTIIKSDRDAVKSGLSALIGAFEPLKGLFGGGLFGSMLGSKPTVVGNENNQEY
jgi:hypothetical protein